MLAMDPCGRFALRSEDLLVVSIHIELQAIPLLVPVQPQVDWIAAGHALFIEFLVPLAGIKLNGRVMSAVGTNDGFSRVVAHINLQAIGRYNKGSLSLLTLSCRKNGGMIPFPLNIPTKKITPFSARLSGQQRPQCGLRRLPIALTEQQIMIQLMVEVIE